METKICSFCKEEKNIEEFRYTQGKYRGECKKCEAYKHKLYCRAHKDKIKEIAHKTYENNKEKYHERAMKNKDKMKEYNKEYYKNNKEYYKEYCKKYKVEHRNLINEKRNSWRKNNEEKVKAMQQKDYLRRRKDLVLRLKDTTRNMIKDAFKRRGYKKSKKLEEICCCTLDELIKHLIGTYEQNYNEEWKWEYVKDVHIDHIVPLAIAKTEKEVIKLNHYSNLQLLKAVENLKKGSKIIY